MLKLKAIAKQCRLNCLDVLESAGVGHNGGSMSEIDILVGLYFWGAKTDPKNPLWENRDRIILSKAHCCEGLYAVLGEAGFFPKEEFKTYGTYGSRLQGHSEVSTPGVEYSGGSLGQGISFAIGKALALKGKDVYVYCIMGDGECGEGQVWEAAASAATYGLWNLIVIVDDNKYCTIGKTDQLLNIEPLARRWATFGFEVKEIDGNDMQQVVDAIQWAKIKTNRPHCIIANTIKGKGVPSWEIKHPHIEAGQVLFDGIQEGRKAL